MLDFNPVYFTRVYYDKHNFSMSLFSDFLSVALLVQTGGSNPLKTCQD